MDLGSILDSRPEKVISTSLNTPANIEKTTVSVFVFLVEIQKLGPKYPHEKEGDSVTASLEKPEKWPIL
jgi:hypothetical protein